MRLLAQTFILLASLLLVSSTPEQQENNEGGCQSGENGSDGNAWSPDSSAESLELPNASLTCNLARLPDAVVSAGRCRWSCCVSR